MVYTTIAFILVGIVFCCLLIENKQRSIFKCRYKGKTYYRNNNIVSAVIKQFFWNKNGECAAEFEIENFGITSVLPISENKLEKVLEKGVGGKVFLLKLETIDDCFAVQFFPLSFISGQDEILEWIDIKALNIEEMKTIENVAKKMFVGVYVLLGLAFFFAVEMPMLSYVLSILSGYIILNYVPFKNWTKETHIGIIKKSKNAQIKIDENNPISQAKKQAGYNEMSSVEKEIFNIRERIMGVKQSAASISDTAEDTTLVQPQTEQEVSDIEEYYNEVNYFCCKNCGCLIPKDSIFCCYCGQNILQNNIGNECVKTVENQFSGENTESTDKFPDESIEEISKEFSGDSLNMLESLNEIEQEKTMPSHINYDILLMESVSENEDKPDTKSLQKDNEPELPSSCGSIDVNSFLTEKIQCDDIQDVSTVTNTETIAGVRNEDCGIQENGSSNHLKQLNGQREKVQSPHKSNAPKNKKNKPNRTKNKMADLKHNNVHSIIDDATCCEKLLYDLKTHDNTSQKPPKENPTINNKTTKKESSEFDELFDKII